MGVWLPLALANITALLVVLIRAWSSTPEKVKIPKLSETLASWCLPFLSSSLRETEKEQEALELFESVQSLAARQGEHSTRP
jgi:hypothetical protein